MFVQIGDRPIQKGTRLSIENTLFFRKIICENANRFIFSSFRDEAVKKLNPRKINKDQYLFEKKEFEAWHKRNKSYETDFN